MVRQLDRGVSAVLVVGLGLMYMAVHPLHYRSIAPYADAIPTQRVSS